MATEAYALQRDSHVINQIKNLLGYSDEKPEKEKEKEKEQEKEKENENL